MRKLFILILLLPASAGLASVAEWKTFEEKVREADAIVHGTITGAETRRDPSGKWLLTYTTVDVRNSLKGNAGQQITVVTPGGSENGLHQRTIGIPEFRPGDERILFTRRSPLGTTLLYQEQGTYEVVRSGRETLVVPVSSDLILYDPAIGTVESAETSRPLEQFVKAIERVDPGRSRDPFRADTQPKIAEEPGSWLDELDNPLWLILLITALILALVYRKLR